VNLDFSFTDEPMISSVSCHRYHAVDRKDFSPGVAAVCNQVLPTETFLTMRRLEVEKDRMILVFQDSNGNVLLQLPWVSSMLKI
jgi:hypothetical protein